MVRARGRAIVRELDWRLSVSRTSAANTRLLRWFPAVCLLHNITRYV